VAVTGLGLPARFILTGGQRQDVTQAGALLDGLSPEVVIADRGYDSRSLVTAIEAAGAEAVIPTQSDRSVQRTIDRERYRDRNLAERFWAKLKQYRRVATRYEKTARNFLAIVHLTASMILLQ
jgi:transposase